MTDLENAIGNVPRVYEAGKKAYCNEFWDKFQDYGNRINYANAFYGWNDTFYNPKHRFKNVGAVGYMYDASAITDTKVDIIHGSGGRVDDFMYMFRNAKQLVTIRKLGSVRTGHQFQGTFNNCIALENIVLDLVVENNISFQQSTKLTKASIENIISVLSSEVTGKTLTLSEAAVNAAFETAEGLADGSASAEWLELRGSKTNWTISLM